ncbi:MAG: PAS domain S-box protein [Ignavibacteriales bacterium]|nr:PAS domain S-box protein [Ignavibacteriales bacterium]
MTSNVKTNTLQQSLTGTPSVIIDKGGKIIALSPEFKNLIPASNAQVNFFELFDEDRLLTLQRIFIDVRKFETISKDIIQLETTLGQTSFEIVISPLRSENNIYFLVNFNEANQNRISSETNKLWIASTELEKIVDDKRIISVINKIKLTFPFTFIEKAKIQKEINELSEYFWIKDNESNYQLVNDKYADSLGFKANQLENKKEEEFLPKYLTNLYKTVDSYIMSSTNSVIIDSISSPIAAGALRNLSVVQFPLCDLDNNVVAIIGFSQKSEQSLTCKNQTNIQFYLREIPSPVIFFDKEFKISAYTYEFLRFMSISEKMDLIGQEITKIFEKGLIPFIENYLKDEKLTGDQVFDYVLMEKKQLNVEVHLKKIFDENFEYTGTRISLVQNVEKNSETEAKAKMYDAIIQYSHQAMFVYDIENLKFLEVNEEALKLYGYKRGEFLNMDLTDLYAPEDIQTIIQSGESKLVPGSYSGPWRHKKNDGTSVLVEINRSSIEFNDKKCHLNIVRNVSEQAELKKRSQILETAFEYSGDAIFNTDKDGFITEINDSVSKRLGYSKKDLQTRPFITLVSDEDRAKVNKNIFHSGLLKTITLEVGFKKPSGTFQKATVIAAPIKDYNGDIDSFILIIKLIDEPVNSKDVKHLQEDSASKADPPFLSNVFHEILTPINVILGFTQELGDSIPDPNGEQKEAIDIIKENQKLLLQVMDNAVEYSTLEQKVIKFKPEEIKFIDVINELKENTRKTAEDKKVEMAYGKISTSLMLETDRSKFLSLLSLFIKFAIQITKENSIYLSAGIYDSNFCAVRIKDTRNAITPYLVKAFTEIFSEDENMSRRNYGFSRFSVKLAKKIIELLSVRKEIIMKEGEPQEYALIFPLKFVIGDKEKMEVESVVASKKTETKQHTQPSIKQFAEDLAGEKIMVSEKKQLDLSQLSCLYLEDQVDSQMLFKVQLKDLKSIEFAPSFESALPLLKTKKFDFIVMDINLQGEYNGLDALRIIRKMPGYKDIPIIASTAYVQPGARDNFISAGFTEFVSKPLLREKLLDVIRILFS